MEAILIRAAFYVGWPKAWAAFRMAKEVLGLGTVTNLNQIRLWKGTFLPK